VLLGKTAMSNTSKVRGSQIKTNADNEVEKSDRNRGDISVSNMYIICSNYNHSDVQSSESKHSARHRAAILRRNKAT
jgi:hypothetical protein